MSETLENLSSETRQFPPPADLAANANVKADAYEVAAADRLAFWAEQAGRLAWTKPWDQILDWSNPPFAKWFVGGELNIAYNCVDRHVEAGNGDKVAIHWEGEPGDTRTVTYADLQKLVSQAANTLTGLGVTAGDRVMIYLPMIPEAAVAMLACARIGATHSVVFGGFSVDALATRIEDADAKVVITADGGYRRGKPSALKPTVDEAVARTDRIEHVLVVRRTGEEVAWTDKDKWWHETVEQASPEHKAQAFDSEHPLFILYTSGTTGKPKGILHTTGGYLTQTSYTHHAVFDLKPETDVYWCTADIGWVTGHSYIVYGPLSNGATQVMYEGTPDTPDRGRFWQIVDKYKVSILYTAPTLIRTMMKWGDDIPAKYDLSSLRVLGSVGEPINPEAWIWYRQHVGRERTPIVDTWWQTETGAIMISPLPGVTAAKPGSAMTALPGISADVVDDEARSVPDGGGGFLVLRDPWPSMLRTIWGDDQRFLDTYWSRFGAGSGSGSSDEWIYFAGDGAKKDEDGALWLLGRVDDVMLVSGHNISTTEVESALVSHPAVAEAAVVGAADATTGQAIVAFTIPRGNVDTTGDAGEALIKDLRDHVAKTLGPIAKPRQIMLVPELPKTRSGKIMRRLLRDVAENRSLGDVTTLQDSAVMDLISSGLQTAKSED
ncbi:acetyl-CoA synthetase [Actinoplanes campanulatus]|uniref:Acetyl-coenzyme A synthetase n=1 Tax=Actinoplanes campanulatus TaxID=113559 RepID=A0A7W5APB4_9ACTN|nr:acetate--CoA ligase [Actinoplanes campanulatus]MBB3099810.1 acetyl-CoA synthetase [Actinoplanes campanulatus]GGN47259.1 acetyl-coenzyme A synthetase [Actinoplanes campanulatus]GID40370.1 acetyl-coenzyme A synthetase [Actinoplanes campanulatus]